MDLRRKTKTTLSSGKEGTSIGRGDNKSKHIFNSPTTTTPEQIREDTPTGDGQCVQ